MSHWNINSRSADIKCTGFISYPWCLVQCLGMDRTFTILPLASPTIGTHAWIGAKAAMKIQTSLENGCLDSPNPVPRTYLSPNQEWSTKVEGREREKQEASGGPGHQHCILTIMNKDSTYVNHPPGVKLTINSNCPKTYSNSSCYLTWKWLKVQVNVPKLLYHSINQIIQTS